MARFFEADERYIGDDSLSGGSGSDQTQFIPPPITIARTIADSDFTNTVTPDALAATANDFSLPNGIYFRLSTDGVARIITGFAGVQAGRLVFICNVAGAANITLNHQDAGSAAENRIITGPAAAAVAIQPDGAATLFYDAVTTRWRVVAIR